MPDTVSEGGGQPHARGRQSYLAARSAQLVRGASGPCAPRSPPAPSLQASTSIRRAYAGQGSRRPRPRTSLRQVRTRMAPALMTALDQHYLLNFSHAYHPAEFGGDRGSDRLAFRGRGAPTARVARPVLRQGLAGWQPLPPRNQKPRVDGVRRGFLHPRAQRVEKCLAQYADDAGSAIVLRCRTLTSAPARSTRCSRRTSLSWVTTVPQRHRLRVVHRTAPERSAMSPEHGVPEDSGPGQPLPPANVAMSKYSRQVLDELCHAWV